MEAENEREKKKWREHEGKKMREVISKIKFILYR